MSFVSLYRKWRSQNFDEVVGQIHVTKTLKNAIESDRISHAYLFCGPRGTGKTSTARILAKALNCENGPISQPCNRCDTCKQISTGTALDVIEIDAASNRGINEIRELREKVKYAPTRGKYKVYIVDEVHMLTKEAFNALLKTLEEPPAHVIFVLATTEPQKLLSTILSRCQRFDFKRISINDTVKHLREISKKELFNIEEEALSLIAGTSEGSLRDALSLLDQLISFTGKNIKVEDVVIVVGSVGEQVFFKLTNCVVHQDPAQALSITRKLVEEGKDINQLIKDFIQYFRDLLVSKVCPDHKGLIDRTSASVKNIEEQAQKLTVGRIMHIIKILTDLKYQLTWDSQWHIQTEIALLRMCQRPIDSSADAIEERLRELEEKIKNLPQITKYEKNPKIKEEFPIQPQMNMEPGDLIGYHSSGKPEEDLPEEPEVRHIAIAEDELPIAKKVSSDAQPETIKVTGEISSDAQPETIKVTGEIPSDAQPEADEIPVELQPQVLPEQPLLPASMDEEIFAQTLEETESQNSPGQGKNEQQDRKLTIDLIKNSWEDFLHKFKRDNLPIYQLLISGELRDLNGKILAISFNNTFYRDQVEDITYKGKIEDALENFFGQKIIIKGKLIEKRVQEMSLFGDSSPAENRDKKPKEKEALSIEDATMLFGGEIIT